MAALLYKYVIVKALLPVLYVRNSFTECYISLSIRKNFAL